MKATYGMADANKQNIKFMMLLNCDDKFIFHATSSAEA